MLVAPITELVAVATFAPAAIRVLDRDQPIGGTSNSRRIGVDAGGVETSKHRPGSVDVIDAPAAEPASILLLDAREIIDRGLDARAACGFSQLREHSNATRADIGCRWVKQRAMIGEWNIVEIVINIVGIERRPTAISTLQSFYPFAAASDRIRITAICQPGSFGTIEPHHHDGRVAEIG